MNTHIPEQVIMKAARIVAARVDQIEADEVEDLAEAMASHYERDIDGYALTKKLDGNGWDEPDADFVEVMDRFSWAVMERWQQWFKVSGAEAPLPIGAHIREGEITGICSHAAAQYEVKPPGQDDTKGISRRIVSFEDARVVDEVAE